jgi:hypothetical protein
LRELDIDTGESESDGIGTDLGWDGSSGGEFPPGGRIKRTLGRAGALSIGAGALSVSTGALSVGAGACSVGDWTRLAAS